MKDKEYPNVVDFLEIQAEKNIERAREGQIVGNVVEEHWFIGKDGRKYRSKAELYEANKRGDERKGRGRKYRGLTVLMLMLFSLSFASAVLISDVTQGNLYSGESANVVIDIKNTLDDDIEDVSLSVVLEGLPFITLGGSEDSEAKIGDGKTESFSFRLKASQNVEPGDYNLPYLLTYNVQNGSHVQKIGSVGIVVGAKTELEFSASADGPAIVGQKGKVTLEIRNLGFGDIKFMSMKISPQGYTLLESGDDYLGTIGSDDLESASFDVIFNDEDAKLIATITYKDFENNEISEDIELDLTVYSRSKALELGLIKKSYVGVYIGVIVALIVLWFVYRSVKKRRRRKKKEA